MVNHKKVTPEVEALIRHYFSKGYNVARIKYCLQERFNITLSTSYLYRHVLPRLGLCRKGKNMASFEIVVQAYMAEISNGANLMSSAKYMLQILRKKHNLCVARSTVRALHQIFVPELVERRKRGKMMRRCYRSKGPDYLWHIDGYDKLSSYGLCIHGCIDGFSRYMIWLECGVTNHDPKQIASYFLKAVHRLGGCPNTVRADHGTENVNVEHSQIFLTQEAHRPDALGPFIYGSSNHNQRIERFWGLLRMWRIDWWRNHFKDMVSVGMLLHGDPIDKMIVPFCYMGIIQDDLQDTLEYHNYHLIRKQRKGDIVSGVPDMLYHNPELKGTVKYLIPVDVHYLQAATDILSSEIPLNEAFRIVAEGVCRENGLDYNPTNAKEADILYNNIRPIIRNLLN